MQMMGLGGVGRRGRRPSVGGGLAREASKYFIKVRRNSCVLYERVACESAAGAYSYKLHNSQSVHVG